MATTNYAANAYYLIYLIKLNSEKYFELAGLRKIELNI